MKATIVVNLQLTSIEDFAEADITAAADEFVRNLANDTKAIFRLDDVMILTSKIFPHEGEKSDDSSC